MQKLSRNLILSFQKEILSWYAVNKRDLPWRKTRDPYRILVSEIMLQQTQVGRVIPKYEAWLKAFPDVESLASAKISDVLRLWSGLGYNRRALYLQRAAQALHELRSRNYEFWRKDGDYGYWPRDVKELEKLPGIGKYTAGAVACFAFNTQVAVVDTNIRKVILTKLCQDHPERGSEFAKSRVEGSHGDSSSKGLRMTPKELQSIAYQLLPAGKAYEWNQALMDYAASVLSREKIAVKKQTRFHGSDRYYRGQILKYLLNHGSVTYGEIRELAGDKNEEWFWGILRGLEKEGFLRIDGNRIRLA